MTIRRFVGALILLTLSVGAATPAAAQSISAMAADLQMLQVRVAAGDKAAYSAQTERLAAIGAAIAAAKPEVWKSKSETNAAVVYLLSGGQPREIAQLLQNGLVPESEKPLMRGALAYIVGNEAEAKALLGELDPRSLDLRLAGQVAFAQSVLATSKDAKKAIASLDLARLLAPGCLVEEAALRREILLLNGAGDIDRVALLSRQYASRFGHSVYAESFLQGLAGTLVQSGSIEALSNFQKFGAFFTVLAPDTRRAFLLTVARAEMLNGKFPVAGAAAGEALSDAPRESADEARGKLYQGAAQILGPEYEDGLALLQSVAAAKLDKGDQALLGAVRGVAAYLREPPAEADPARGAVAPAPPVANDEAEATIALAEAAMSRTAALAGASEKGNL